jgi:hypothetical protein
VTYLPPRDDLTMLPAEEDDPPSPPVVHARAIVARVMTTVRRDRRTVAERRLRERRQAPDRETAEHARRRRQLRTWVHGLLATLLNGIATGSTLIIADPATFNLGAGWRRLAIVSGLTGLLGAANYLKRSPLP